MKNKLLIISAVITSACVSQPPQISSGGRSVQVHAQTSTAVANCQRLGPISATAEQAAAPQTVFKYALAEAREKTYLKGGDAFILVNDEQRFSGLATHTVTVSGIALKCF